VAKKRGKKRQQKKQEQRDRLAAAPAEDEGVDGGEDDDGADEDDGPAPPVDTAAPPDGAADASPAVNVTTVPGAPSADPAPVTQIGTPVTAPAALVAPEKPVEAASPAVSEGASKTAPLPPPGTEPLADGTWEWPKTLGALLEEQLSLSKSYIFVLIAACVFAVYANALKVPFLFDDAPVITRNRDFRELSLENAIAVARHMPTRALTNLTFYINYHIAGTPAYQYADGSYGSTAPYHIFNMALHAGNGILLYILLLTLFQGTPQKTRATAARRAASRAGTPLQAVNEDPIAPLASWVALGATLLWLVHPVQTMAVSYITQRYALCAAAMMFGTLICYAKLRRRMEAGTAWLDANTVGSHLLFLGVVVLGVLEWGTKENSAITPFLLVAMELTFFQSTAKDTQTPPLWLEVFPAGLRRWVLAGSLFPFFALLIAHRASTVGLASLIPADCPTFPDRMSYFQTEWVVLLKYFKLWAMPTDLTVEQAFPPLLWSNPEHVRHMLLALVGHALILTLAVIWWRSGRRFLTFAVFWYYGTQAVESSILPILDPMVEHRLYIPSAMMSAAVAFAVARGASSIYNYGPDWTRRFATRFLGAIGAPDLEEGITSRLEPLRQKVYALRHQIAVGIMGALALAIVLYGIGTVIRNFAWGNQEYPYRIWEDVIEKRPDCARAYSSLGMEMLYKGRWIEAVQPIETALYLGPYHVEGWNNIGKAYLELGSNMPNIKNDDPKKASIEPNPLLIFAKETLEQGIEVNKVAPSPSVPLCWNNLGLTYLKMSERVGKSKPTEVLRLEREAAVALTEAVKLDPGYETAWINLGTTYVRQAELAGPDEKRSLALKAVEALHSSGTLKPQHQLFQIAALNCALADRMAEHHAEAFALFSALLDGENGPTIQREYREEAGAMADEMTVLPTQIVRAASEIAQARSPGEKKQLQDLQADLKRELADCKTYTAVLVQAGVKYVADGEKLATQDPKGAVQYLRFGGTLLFGAGDVPRAVAAYDRAIQLAVGDEKEKVEHERALFMSQSAPAPMPPGPRGP
jgi:tetratricopeptide (TPR) repeat protein